MMHLLERKTKKMVKIIINLSKKEINHIYPNHTFYNECDDVRKIMKKIQKECKKMKYNG